MNSMQDNTKWYWEQTKEKNIIVPTRTIIHPCLNIMAVTYLKQLPKKVCNRNQDYKVLQRNTIFLTDSDNEFILAEIKCIGTIEYDIDMSVGDKDD